MTSDDELLEASQEVEDLLEIEQIAMEKQNTRFKEPVSDKYLEQMSLSAEPRNTLKRNKWAINTFNAWAISRNNKHEEGEKEVIRSLEVMEDKELNHWLSRFVCEVLKVDGTEYPAKSLLSLCMGIQAHIRITCKRNFDILRNPHFETFRQIMDGKMKTLTRSGVGNAPRQAEPFTPDEEDMFWKGKLLGDHNAKVLLKTMLYLNGKHFALRSGAEHRTLRFTNSQIQLKSKDGVEYLEYTEDTSKTNQGGLKHLRVKKKSARSYPNADESRCHVRLYKLYMQLCPQSGRDGAFYLSPLQKPQERVWYSRQAVGHNTLQKMIPELARDAGMSGHYTNHSLRSTAATALYRAGVDEQLIMDQTGHRSLSGVRSYKRKSEDQMRSVSETLSSVSAKKPKIEDKVDASVQQVENERDQNDQPCSQNSKFTFVNCTFNM